jgi:hypothetical protein
MASVFSEAEWVALFEAGHMPEVFVNVMDLQARIMVKRPGTEDYVDITGEIENGPELARKAVEEAGGQITWSGWYPPNDEILRAIERKRWQKDEEIKKQIKKAVDIFLREGRNIGLTEDQVQWLDGNADPEICWEKLPSEFLSGLKIK